MNYINIKLSNKGLVFSVTEFADKYSKELYLKLKNRLTVKSLLKITNTWITTPMFVVFKKDNNHYLELPRFSINELKKIKIKNNIISDLPDHEYVEYNFIGQLHSNQLIIMNYLFDQLFPSQHQYFKGAIIKAVAGSGKSICGMYIISYLKVKTLIIVPTTYLLEQWVALLNEYFPDNQIGYFYGKKKFT